MCKNGSGAEVEHCWHFNKRDTSIVMTDNGRYAVSHYYERCCWCGEEKLVQDGEVLVYFPGTNGKC